MNTQKIRSTLTADHPFLGTVVYGSLSALFAGVAIPAFADAVQQSVEESPDGLSSLVTVASIAASYGLGRLMQRARRSGQPAPTPVVEEPAMYR
jgi:hypothetical protein